MAKRTPNASDAEVAAQHAALLYLVLAAINRLLPAEPAARNEAIRAIGNDAMKFLDRATWSPLDQAASATLRELSHARLMSLCSAMGQLAKAAPAPD